MINYLLPAEVALSWRTSRNFLLHPPPRKPRHEPLVLGIAGLSLVRASLSSFSPTGVGTPRLLLASAPKPASPRSNHSP